MGQSNMTGTIYAKQSPVPHVTMNYSGANRSPYPQPEYSGPGIEFGRQRASKGKEVLLLQCAVGGTKIDRWVPGADLYESCMGLIDATGLPVTGVLFSQGENDTVAPVPWKDQFGLMVGGLRSKVGSVPIIYAQLGALPQPSGNAVFYSFIKQEQASVSLPGVHMITQDDLALCEGWHFCTESYAEIGRRMERAVQGVL